MPRQAPLNSAGDRHQRRSHALKRHRPARRAHETWPSKARWFCSAYFVTSGDRWPVPFAATQLIFFGLPIIYYIFCSDYIWKHFSPALVIIFAYLNLIGWSSMVRTAFVEPGWLPRGLDRDPPTRLQTDLNVSPGDSDAHYAVTREVQVIKGSVRVKWCETCEIYRPPRSSHCAHCDACIDGLDHHCAFLNQCIGRRNYFSFLTLAVSSTICLIWMAVTSALILRHRTHATDQRFVDVLRSKLGIVSAIVFILSIAALPPILSLTLYHSRLVWTNSTTIERLRHKAAETYRLETTEPVAFKTRPSPFERYQRLRHRSLGPREPFESAFGMPSILRNCLWSAFRPGTDVSCIRPRSQVSPPPPATSTPAPPQTN